MAPKAPRTPDDPNESNKLPPPPLGHETSVKPSEVLRALSGLSKQVDGLGRSVNEEKEVQVKQNRINERRVFWGKCLLAGVSVLALVAMVASTMAIVLWVNRGKELARSRRGSCIQYNVQADKALVAAEKHDEFLVATASRGAIKPDEPTVQQFIAGDVAVTASVYPYRDCSKRGISQFLKSGLPDPAGKCVNDGNGFCKSKE